MEQSTLPLTRCQGEQSRIASPSAGEVAIDRDDDRDLILRFLSKSVTWGEPSRLVRIDLRLAEQLWRLLEDELEDAAA